MYAPNILIADDDPDFSLLFKDMFREKPWRIAFAQDGQEAVDLLGKDHFDLALLDLYMPRLSGLEVVQHIRQKELPIRIILMTGYGTRDGTLQKAIQAIKNGAIDVVEKPFSQKVFMKTIERQLTPFDLTTQALAVQLDVYLKENASDPDLKLQNLCKQFRITARYVTKLFRAHFETTFRDRLAQYRIQTAKKLIRETNAPLYEIAEICGFKDYRRLTSTFNRLEKITPRKYREMSVLHDLG